MEVALDGSPRTFAVGLVGHFATTLRIGGNDIYSIWAWLHDGSVFVEDDDSTIQARPAEGGGPARPARPRLILGLPKVAWALIADIVAMLAFVACIPFVLTIAKRRRSATPTTS